MQYEFTIKVLSPLHIGSLKGEVRALSFITRGDQILLSNEAALARVLHEEGLIDHYVDYIQSGNRPSLDGFIQTISDLKKRTEVEKRCCERKIAWQQGNAPPLAIRTLQTDPLTGDPILPGSSLKGALRITLLHQLCVNDPRVLQRLLQDLEQIRGKQRAGERLDIQLLQSGGLKGVKGPNQDWLRTVRVSDAFADKAKTKVLPVKILSLNNENDGSHLSASGSTIFTEVFQAGTEFTFPVNFDQILYNELKRKNNNAASWQFEEWLQGMKQRFKLLLNEDQDFAAKADKKELSSSLDKLVEQGANFRMGWGSGLLSTSINLLVPPEQRRQIRSKFFPFRKHLDFPQSRKVVFNENNQPATLMGYCHLDWKRVG